MSTARSPHPDSGAMAPPETIGPYSVLGVLGKGGMGTVYLAERSSPTHRVVAIKVVTGRRERPDALARFSVERRVSRALRHPNVARTLGSGRTRKGVPYLVMEYVRGLPIHEFCDRHRLSIRERVQLVLDVCRGVQHMHDCGVVHRDLKPSNVLATCHGDRPVAKIIDFGLAKVVSTVALGAPSLTGIGWFVGTPDYASPEQAQLSGVDIDGRADIYSIGSLLYELLVGTPPHGSLSVRRLGFTEVRRRILEEIPLPPSVRLAQLGEAADGVFAARRTHRRALRSALCAGLDDIVMRAMEKDPGRRHAAPSLLADDLQRWLARRQRAEERRGGGRRSLWAVAAALFGSLGQRRTSRRPAPPLVGRSGAA